MFSLLPSHQQVSLIKLRKIFSVKNDIAVLVDAASKATEIGGGLDDKVEDEIAICICFNKLVFIN
jgi:hypothetical protein